MTLPILTLVVKRVTVVSDEHHIKARKPIEVTLEGIITDVSDEHHSKAPAPIEVVLLLKLIVQGVDCLLYTSPSPRDS